MKFHKNKLFLIGLVLIFIFILLSVVFGYFWMRYYKNINVTEKTSDESGDREEYRNEELGYSIKCPKDFNPQNSNFYNFSIDVQENKSNLSSKDWVKNLKNTKIFSEKEVVIDNEKGYQITIFGYYCTIQQTYINHNKKMYLISFPTTNNPNDPEAEKHYEESLKILNSFEFI